MILEDFFYKNNFGDLATIASSAMLIFLRIHLRILINSVWLYLAITIKNYLGIITEDLITEMLHL